ncbi:DUF421 domain-containing protein [Caballeronia glathei]|uniref:YetF C-terminal domain-containing protein n=1 Tax=Caballeronia glathei TaxID=60547 RepID=A0A069PAS9_9BURK|nr:YetF domain-containing protein [Caballeronia glathei]KDR37755.1 hypothetical protein BG61_07810 [Caballeronia glathei]
MDALDWQDLFSFSMSPLEIVLRGTFMYWLLFLLFRFVARRDIGSVGIADLLIIVIVADAAQNGMAGDADSLADAGLLVTTLVAWNRLIDAAAFYWPAFNRFANAKKVLLVSHGRKLHDSMRREAITDEELDAKLRENGASSLEEVERMYLESDGQISVVKKK